MFTKPLLCKKDKAELMFSALSPMFDPRLKYILFFISIPCDADAGEARL
jgi:hypothetical protein